MCRFAVLAALLAARTACAASWPLPLFTSDPKQVLDEAARVTPPAGADSMYLSVALDVRLDAAGKAAWTQHGVIRVLTPAGVKLFSSFTVPFSPWRQNRPGARYRVITADGVAHPLDPATITEAGVPSALMAGMFSDRKVLSAPLPAIAVGSVIEQELRMEDHDVLYPGGQLLYFPLGATGAMPIRNVHVTIEAPGPVHVVAREVEFQRKEESLPGGGKRLTLDADAAAPPPARTLLPPDLSPLPSLAIAMGATWPKLAAWYAEIVDKLAGPNPPASSQPGDARERAARVFAALQPKVRYTGLELGAGSYIPRSPEETLKRGYGDCKDKAVLLVSELRKAGIAASVALLTPYPAPDVHPNLPGAEAFQHAIVYVPGATPMWLDPSPEMSVASRLPIADQGRLALIADKSTTELTRTPESRAEDNVILEDGALELSDKDGKGRMTNKVTASGGYEDTLRPALSQASGRVAFQKSVASGDQSLVLDWGKVEDTTRPLEIVIRAEQYPFATTNGRYAHAAFPAAGVDFTLFTPLARDVLAAKEPRTVDYYVPFAFTSERRIHIVPPPGMTAEDLPDLKTVPFGPVTLFREIKQNGDGTLDVVQRLVSPRRRYTPAEARVMAELIKQLTAAPAIVINFRAKQ